MHFRLPLIARKPICKAYSSHSEENRQNKGHARSMLNVGLAMSATFNLNMTSEKGDV